jgi:hypothetical protein
MTSSDPHGSRRDRHVSLSDEEAVKEVVGAAVLELWKAVNTLTRLRPSRRERYRVAIFGSARAQPGSFVYEEVKRMAAAFSASAEDLQIPRCLETADDAIALVRDLHARWSATKQAASL